MFATSREEVIPRTKARIGVQKVLLTIFFSSVKLISPNALPAGARFTQEYFINSSLPDILDEKQRILGRNRRGDFFIHMDNSICHNGRKVTDEFDNRKLQRVARPPYSPDLSPCDFWLFDVLKQKMKDRQFSGVEEIMNAVQEIRREVTLERLHSVFFNWIERLEYVIEHDWEYYINPHYKIKSIFIISRDRWGPGAFWTFYIMI
jgi:histone-lysine N-methyltransferase SETMAR